jgi:hypothetical protein
MSLYYPILNALGKPLINSDGKPLLGFAPGVLTLPVTSGLVGWYDATDASNFSLVGGTAAQTWYDLSGLNNHLTSVGGEAATYSASFKRVNFDGSSDCLYNNSTLGITTPYCTIVRIAQLATAGNSNMVSFSDSSQQYKFISAHDTPTQVSSGMANGSVGNNIADLLNHGGSDFSRRFSASIYNGTQDYKTYNHTGFSAGTTAITGTLSGFNNFNVGRRLRSVGTALYVCRFHEILVYNRPLTSTELDELKIYSNQKWNTPLS